MKKTNTASAAGRQGRAFALKPMACCVALACQAAWANPTGPQVINGNVTFSRPDANSLHIKNSPGSIINWQGFSIGANELTRFVQDSAASTVLNRVVGRDISQLQGQLLSNGRVFLINPAGIAIGAGAVIDTAGFVASTLNMHDADFLAGKLKFQGDASAGSITNSGLIVARGGGDVVLVAPSIHNAKDGVIQSEGGELILAAGQKVTVGSVRLDGVQFEVQAPSDSVVNLGKLIADGGAVGVFAGTLKHSGDIRASALTRDEAGHVVLKAQGDTMLTGNSTITATGTKGGTVQVLGDRVGVLDKSSIDASGTNGGGTVLIGGDYRGLNPAVQNAFATYVGPDTTVRVDATTAGDGGKLIIWSNEATRTHGLLSARGAGGGKGGFVETSGHYLEVGRSPEIGSGGTWLLDPWDIEITNTGTTNNTGAPNFTANDSPSRITPTEIVNFLEGGAGGNVTIDTTGNGLGTQTGNITVTDLIQTTGGALTVTGRTLSLVADGTVNLNAGISVPKHNVSITAGRAGGAGGINLNGGAFIHTGTGSSPAGSITLNAMTGDITFSQGNALPNGALRAEGDNPTAGNVTLIATTGGIVNNFPNTTTISKAATVSITSARGLTGAQLVTDAQAIGVITTGTGDFTINNINQGFTVNASSAANGSLSFFGPANTLMTIGAPVSATDTLLLSTDRVDIAADVTGQTVRIIPRTDATPTEFTSLADPVGAGASTLRLSTGEVGHIRATHLFVGSVASTTGAITFDQAVDFAGVTGSVTLHTAGAVSQTAGATITAPALEVDGGSVSLTEANAVSGAFAGRATSAGGAFSFTNAVPLTVGPVLVFSGITTNDGDTRLTTTGAATNNIVVNSDVGNAAALTVLTSAGNITGSGVIRGTQVGLDAATGIGSALNRVNTAADTLFAHTTTTGDVYLSEANDVTLSSFRLGPAGEIEAAGGGTFDITAAGTITTVRNVPINVGPTATGATLLTTTGANTNNIVAGDSIGNTTGATTLVSAGNITQTAGTVSGANVILDTATGVGTGAGAAGRVSTTATTLAARSTSTTSGGVFVSQTGAVVLDTLGGVANGTAANTPYDVTATGSITVGGDIGTGSGNVTLAAGGDIIGGAGRITSTGAVALTGVGVGTAAAPVLLNLGNTGTISATSTGVNAAGDIAFSDNAAGGLATSRVTLSTDSTTGQQVTITQSGAVGITVDGTIGDVGDNLSLLATAGKITEGAGTVTGNNVVLSGATGVGTSAGARVSTAASTLAARSTTSGGVFVSEANAVTLDTIGLIANGAAGGTYDVTAAGDLTVGSALTTTGAINLRAPVAGTSIVVNGDVTTTNSPITFTGAVNLSGTPKTFTSGTGDLTFTSSVDGAVFLTADNSGTTRFGGAVGAGTPLTALAVNGAAAINGGAIRTTGNQTYSGAVTLGAATTLTSTSGGSISFDSTLDGPHTLGVNATGTGATVFGGVVGGIDPLASLTTNAGGFTNVAGGAITTTGAQTFGDTVFITRLTGPTTFTSTLGGTISFAVLSADLGASLANTANVTINTSGTATFGGGVGIGVPAANPLTSLTTNAGTTAINGGAVRTTGAQTYNNAVTLGADTTVTSTGGSAITFANTLNGDPLNGPFSLTANTTGTTTFGGVVGGTTALTTLTTNALGTTAINGGAITTIGNQTYNDAVTLGMPTTLTATTPGVPGPAATIAFNSTLAAGANALTVTADAIDFNGLAGSVTGTSTLTLQPLADGTSIGIAGGAGTLQISATDVAALADGFSQITIGRASGSGTTTVNAVTFRDPVLIRQPNAPGAIIVDGQITGTGNASITLDGPGATTTLNANIVTADQDITISDSVVVGNGASVTLSTGAAAGGNISITGPIDGTAGGAAENLTLAAGTGNITLGGAVGNVQRLGDVAITSAGNVTAGTIVAATLTQNAGTGTSTFGALDTNGAGGIAITTNIVNLNGPVTTTNGGPLTITNAGLLTLPAGANLTLDGPFTQNGAGVVSTAANITTTSDNIIFDSPVTLTGPVTLSTGGGGDVVFSNTLNGAFDLTVNTTGSTVFGGAVGGTAALTSLTTNAGGTTAIDGGLIRTSGAQTYGDAVTANNATLTTLGAAGITATNAANDFTGTLSLNTGGGNISIRDANALAIGAASVPGGILALSAGGPITQTGAITADTLTLTTANANATLNGATNNIANLGTTALGTGALNLLDAGGLTVTGAVAGGGITLNTSGLLAVNNTINGGAGTVSLITTGGSANTITQNATGVISGGTLALTTSDANATLNAAANVLTNLGAVSLGAGALNLRNLGNLTVAGAVAASGGIALDTTGSLAVNNTVNAGPGNVSLTTTGGAGSGISQTAGITAGTLTVTTTDADAMLNGATNAITTLGATNLGTGALELLDAGGLNVTGLVASGGVTLNTSGALTTTGAGALATSGGPIALTANSIGAAGAGMRVTPAGGTVSATSTAGGAFLEQTAGDVVTSLYTFNAPAGQTIGLTSAAGNMSVDATMNQAGRNILLMANTAGSHIDVLTGVTVNAASLRVDTTAANADLNFAGATVVFNTPLTTGPHITTNVSGASNLTLNGAATLNGPLNWSGGTIGGTSPLTVAATTNITGGTPQIGTAFSPGNFSMTGGTFTIGGAGALNLNGGMSAFTGGTLVNQGALNVQSGNVQVNNVFPINNGTLNVLAGATLTTTTNLTNAFGATIKGNGTIDTSGNAVINNGTFAPGASPGTFTINGNYTQGPGGTLEMELGGTQQGVTYDLLRVSGVANLDGTLKLVPVNGFVPQRENTFTVMTYARRVGDFRALQPGGYETAPRDTSYSVSPANPALSAPQALAEEQTRRTVDEQLAILGSREAEVQAEPAGRQICR